MSFSFNRLWKVLIDKGMTKEALRKELKISPATIAKMGKGENVSLEVIGKICGLLEVQPEDIMEYIPGTEEEKKNEQ